MPDNKNSIIFDKSFLAWKSVENKKHSCYAGDLLAVDTITNEFSSASFGECVNRVGSIINNIPGNFSSILDLGKNIVAFVDRVRSYPIFYKIEYDGSITISNSAYELYDGPPDNIKAIAEIKMSKYVTGNSTLYKNVFQILPGELLVYSKDTSSLSLVKYERYFSDVVYDSIESDLVDGLSSSVDKIFNRMVSKINGREVWIPLSGGLDSRFILCKLKSLGYDRIRTFSYGPNKNHDAKWAKVVADRVGVPWEFVNYTRKSAYDFFWSDKRKKYWRMASNACTVPFMADELALHYLTKVHDYSDVVVINGQSGDFISGGHVSGSHLHLLDPQKEYDTEIVVNAIIAKHYMLNNTLNEGNQDWLRDKIRSISGLDNIKHCTGEFISKHYELWEMSERQSKNVVNGQRSYDFYGIDWFLPLWDKEMVDFWKKVPYNYKVNQKLYKQYLRHNDWFGLFNEFDPVVWNWQGASMLNVPVAKAVEMIFGKNRKNRYYELMSYFGRYSHNYAPFGFIDHVKDIDIYGKNPWGKYSDQLILELKK